MSLAKYNGKIIHKPSNHLYNSLDLSIIFLRLNVVVVTVLTFGSSLFGLVFTWTTLSILRLSPSPEAYTSQATFSLPLPVVSRYWAAPKLSSTEIFLRAESPMAGRAFVNHLFHYSWASFNFCPSAMLVQEISSWLVSTLRALAANSRAPATSALNMFQINFIYFHIHVQFIWNNSADYLIE